MEKEGERWSGEGETKSGEGETKPGEGEMKPGEGEMKSGEVETKRGKTEKVCEVCGAPSLGHNFGAVSCESCKAFFRRNAFRLQVGRTTALG